MLLHVEQAYDTVLGLALDWLPTLPISPARVIACRLHLPIPTALCVHAYIFASRIRRAGTALDFRPHELSYQNRSPFTPPNDAATTGDEEPRGNAMLMLPPSPRECNALDNSLCTHNVPPSQSVWCFTLPTRANGRNQMQLAYWLIARR